MIDHLIPGLMQIACEREKFPCASFALSTSIETGSFSAMIYVGERAHREKPNAKLKAYRGEGLTTKAALSDLSVNVIMNRPFAVEPSEEGGLSTT
jgi:hypothetical protein